MKITENNPELFETLNDAFPTISDIENFLSGVSIPDIAIKNNIYIVSLNYYSRRLSAIFKTCLREYGLQLKNGYYIPSSSVIGRLCDIINARFSTKWSKVYEDINKDYDIFNPLKMKSSYNTLKDHMETSNNITNENESVQDRYDTNETEYDNTDNKVYGFNSSDGVNSDSSKNTSRDSTVIANRIIDNGTKKENYTRDNTSERIVEREGNIGNRLQSEILEKEIEFRKIQLTDIIMNDILSVLTRSKYI